MSETKPGMSSLNEDDVRRICREELIDFSDIVASAIRACGKVYSIESAVKKSRQQATDTEPPANQEASEFPAEEDNTPPCVERRKMPCPKCYK